MTEFADPTVCNGPISILVEGLDGTGKSTTIKALAEKLKAVRKSTPPDIIRPFREWFTDNPDLALRKAYYMVGNFMVGEEIKESLKKGDSVVLDRFYPSTMAYLLGKSDSELPPIEDPIWKWIPELYKPDYMFVLTLNEEDRVKRRSGRMEVEETLEEKLLRERPEIGMKINMAYKRYGCIEIPIQANDTTEVIVDTILRHVYDK